MSSLAGSLLFLLKGTVPNLVRSMRLPLLPCNAPTSILSLSGLRPVNLRCAKSARIVPEAQVSPATAPAENGDAPAPMDVDAAHKITHRCPITFSREFEMRRHIRTVRIAEEIRAVVEGRLPCAEATVVPENQDGKMLSSKSTCTSCGTTFSHPDAVRRHRTEEPCLCGMPWAKGCTKMFSKLSRHQSPQPRPRSRLCSCFNASAGTSFNRFALVPIAPYPPVIIAAVAPAPNVPPFLRSRLFPTPTKTAPTPVVATPSSDVAIPLAALTSIASRPPKPAADALNRPKVD
ncbi:hypothetical protein FRC09_019801 [Ceratobasidium sp. 395]|nr:hypothetical protein FRC09_019801 [Ceratobasidium sp. 395]